MDNNKISEEEISRTMEEIQFIMDGMDKKTFHADTSMEWEGCIQNAPTTKDNHRYSSEPDIPDCGCIYG